MLTFPIAQQWPDTISTALAPGWVPTRMGGTSARDDMDQAHRTQDWLAVANVPAAMRSGRYFHDLKERAANPEAHDPAQACRLLDQCAALCGIELPS